MTLTISPVALIDHILTMAFFSIFLVGLWWAQKKDGADQWITFGLVVFMCAAIVFHFLPK